MCNSAHINLFRFTRVDFALGWTRRDALKCHPPLSASRYRSKSIAAILFAASSLAIFCTPAQAQLALPTSHAGTSISAPTNYHLLFTSAELTQARAQWNSPAANVHASFLTTFNSIKSNSQSRSNQAIVVGVPSSFANAGTHASVAQAKALRWLMEDTDLNPTTGTAAQIAYFNDTRQALLDSKSSASFSWGSGITKPEVLQGYLGAFDMINPYLDTWDVANSQPAGTSRAAIVARLNGTNNLGTLGTGSNEAGNQGVKNKSARGTLALLVGNESNLDSAMGTIRSSYNNASTNDGFWTDGQRYFTYGLVNLPNFLLSYQRINGAAADPTGVAQYVAAMETTIRYNISTAQPNGNSTLMHNGEESPTPLILLSRIVSDTSLKSAALWHFQKSGGMSVGWSSWTNIGNSGDDYLGTDFFVGGDFTVASATPDWSPTYHSGGQAHTAVFKNDWGTTSNFMLISGGMDGGSIAGFVHNDTGAISIAANGTPVITEPGYNRTGLGNTPSGFNSSTAISHNVLLARNTGTTPTTTSWGIGTGTGQTNTGNNMTTTNRLDSQERATVGTYKGVMDFNTLKATYIGSGAGANVQMRRSTGMVNESASDKGYFVMADSFRSTSGPNKDFAVNLLGKSSAANTETVVDTTNYIQLRWTMNGLSNNMSGTTPVYRNGAIINGTPYQNTYSGQVRAHIIASGDLTVIGDSTWIHENYDRYLDVQRRQTYITNKSHGTFLTFFELGVHNAASKWTVTAHSATDQYAAASIASTDGWTDWHISQTDAANVHATTAGSNVSIDSGALESNAQYSYIRRTTGNVLDSLMISRGTTLSSGGLQLIGTSSPVTGSVLYATGNANQYKGTVSGDDLAADTEFSFYNTTKNILSATLNGSPVAVSNDFGAGAKTFTLAGSTGGDFVVNFTDFVNTASFTTAAGADSGPLVDPSPIAGSGNNQTAIYVLDTAINHGHVDISNVINLTLSPNPRILLDFAGSTGAINALLASLGDGSNQSDFTIVTSGLEFNDYVLANPGRPWDAMLVLDNVNPLLEPQLDFGWRFEADQGASLAAFKFATLDTQIPEPASGAALLLGSAMLLRRRRNA